MLFNCHKSEAHVIEKLTPYDDHCVLLNMVRFVDNSTPITGGNKTNTVQNLLKNARRCAILVRLENGVPERI